MKCNNQDFAHHYAEGSPICDCGSMQRDIAPTPSTDWEREFDEKWRVYFGDCVCNKEAFVKPFVRNLFTTEREKERDRIISIAEGMRVENKAAKPADEIETVDERAYDAALSHLIFKLRE